MRSRRILLEALSPDGLRRFVTELPKSLSLDGEAPQTWATVTKIGLRFLEYVEQDRFALLPAPVYLRGFLLEYAPGRLVVGTGPLDPRPCRSAGRLACYAPDFFLADAQPWLHPTAWHETTRDALRDALGDARSPRVTWETPDAAGYSARFATLMDRIRSGTLAKAVPVILERGTWQAPSDDAAHGLVRAVGAGSSRGVLFYALGPTLQELHRLLTDPHLEVGREVAQFVVQPRIFEVGHDLAQDDQRSHGQEPRGESRLDVAANDSTQEQRGDGQHRRVRHQRWPERRCLFVAPG